MTAYYNEFDPFAAAWLRNLIAKGLIAPGDVDERSIEDVRPTELAGYTQCHFFAGIGIWSYALRRAGIADDTPLWTGSCPCQPFSAAGEGAGMDDERHLWPAFFHLIRECRPAKVLGEQVASKDAEPWIDLVCADLGSLGYASGAIAFPAAGVGAPHIRDRLYWVGDAERAGLEGHRQGLAAARGWNGALRPVATAGESRGMAHANEGQRGPWRAGAERAIRSHAELAGRDSACGVADCDCERLPEQHVCLRAESEGGRDQADLPEAGRSGRLVFAAGERADGGHVGALPASAPAGPVNGFWRAADWLACRDGKWRPVEPGTFPLATGIAGRVGQLRAYGNGLNASQAICFIESVMEAA